MKRRQGFTLIEIAISVFILALLLLLALPSVSGVMADRRLKQSLDAMNKIVRKAQERSVQERRSYVIEWQKRAIVLRPESPREGDSDRAHSHARAGEGSRLHPAVAGCARERSLRAMDLLAFGRLRAGEREIQRAGRFAGK